MSLQKNTIKKAELLRLYNLNLDELLKISAMYVKDTVEFCSLVNARNGKCSQNCKYCAQSSHYNTNIETFPLISPSQVKKNAMDSLQNKVTRFAVVTSGKTPDESDFDTILEMIKEINKIQGLKSCASIGILNENQAKKLAQAGLTRFHHNINTAKSYYPQVCTTHNFEERINTCRLVKKYGMELCCGVILGMGETIEQRVEMALTLAKIQPESIPVNILMPIPNTPFEGYIDKIDEEHILKTLAIFKITNPKSVIRLCGGRMRLSRENQEKALHFCAEGLMTGNYLTTTGQNPQQDIQMVQRIGKKIIC